MLDANKDFDDLNLADSEEAIEAALKYLQYHDSANANREYAIGLLKKMQEVSGSIADKNELSFEEFVETYNDSQKKV